VPVDRDPQTEERRPPLGEASVGEHANTDSGVVAEGLDSYTDLVPPPEALEPDRAPRVESMPENGVLPAEVSPERSLDVNLQAVKMVKMVSVPRISLARTRR